MKYRFLPWASENLPKIGMKAAVMMRDSRGTQSTSQIGALRFMEIVGSMQRHYPGVEGRDEVADVHRREGEPLAPLRERFARMSRDVRALYDRSERTAARYGARTRHTRGTASSPRLKVRSADVRGRGRLVRLEPRGGGRSSRRCSLPLVSLADPSAPVGRRRPPPPGHRPTGRR